MEGEFPLLITVRYFPQPFPGRTDSIQLPFRFRQIQLYFSRTVAQQNRSIRGPFQIEHPISGGKSRPFSQRISEMQHNHPFRFRQRSAVERNRSENGEPFPGKDFHDFPRPPFAFRKHECLRPQ